MDEKLETFLAQFKSLDALSLSIVEELRMLKASNMLLKTQNEELRSKLIEERNKVTRLEELVNTPQATVASDVTEATATKSKKQVKTVKTESTPSLF